MTTNRLRPRGPRKAPKALALIYSQRWCTLLVTTSTCSFLRNKQSRAHAHVRNARARAHATYWSRRHARRTAGTDCILLSGRKNRPHKSDVSQLDVGISLTMVAINHRKPNCPGTISH